MRTSSVKRFCACLFVGAVLSIPLWLSGCTISPGELAAIVGQLKGDTATACVTVQGAWGTATAVRVNQNSTSVDGCKISQGMNIAPLPPTVIITGTPGQPTQVIR